MTDEQTPPDNLVEQCNLINREWLINTKTRLELYMSRSSDFGDSWKFQLIDEGTNNIIMKHIVPENVSGHMLSLTIDVARRQFHIGAIEGKVHAVKCFADKCCEMFGLPTGMLCIDKEAVSKVAERYLHHDF